MAANIEFFGWYHNTKENSDKIWGWLSIDTTNCYFFWARRGGRMQFKRAESRAEAYQKSRHKESKSGYQSIVDDDEIDRLYPGFIKIVERQLFNAKMRDKV